MGGALALAMACSGADELGTDDPNVVDGMGGNGLGGNGFGGGSGSAPAGMGGNPQAPATCGNGVVDPGEACDGAVPQTCAAATMNALPLGAVTCVACQMDITTCYSEGGAGGGPGTGGAVGTGGMDPGGGGTSSGGAGVGGSPVPPQPGTCCTGCICRGPDPVDGVLDRNGPYGSATFQIPRGTNHGGATVYYPTSADAPWGAVAFCPGYTATKSSIAAWGPFFASHGIVLATMDTVTTGDYPPQRADGLVEMIGDLTAENTRAGSPLQGKLDTNRMGIGGWSMGGGGTWIASGRHPELKTATTLAGHNATATGWQASASVSTVPTIMLNGATDTSILGGQNQTPNAYNAIPDTTPKLMYIMNGEGHFSWGTPTTKQNASGRYVMAWQKTFLEGDERYRRFLLVRGPDASVFETNVR